MQTYDVIVVGKGNAALCAALSARDQGASVAMLEAASEDESGGNSRFAGGVMRFAYESVDDLKRVTEVTDEEIANSDFGTNTTDEFFDDLFRLTSFRTDADLSETLVTEQPRHDGMAALQRRALRAELRPPVGARRRQAQVLRAHADRSRRAAARAWCSTSTPP